MPDVLIRGLSASAVERIDAAAAQRGLSRNEYLRRQFEAQPAAAAADTFTVADLRRATDAVRDLLDPEVMESAWR